MSQVLRLDGYGRRQFLGLAAVSAGMVLSGGGSGASLAKAAGSGARSLHFHNLHTKESLSAVYWHDGHLDRDALAKIDHHLRDFRTGDVYPIDPMLLELLHQLCGVMNPDGPIQVISGYRSPETNAMLAKRNNGVAKNSYHTRGMAIDLRLPGCKLAELRRTAIGLKLGGVGFYPKSDFVHVDTGPVRAW